ncbi:hypothetical protein BKA57DRAFT_195273 [Linnemannia elongata]|nr:hypothetical protein BKA57DRAFT_195273 [Linnemannia elongata]
MGTMGTMQSTSLSVSPSLSFSLSLFPSLPLTRSLTAHERNLLYSYLHSFLLSFLYPPSPLVSSPFTLLCSFPYFFSFLSFFFSFSFPYSSSCFVFHLLLACLFLFHLLHLLHSFLPSVSHSPVPIPVCIHCHRHSSFPLLVTLPQLSSPTRFPSLYIHPSSLEFSISHSTLTVQRRQTCLTRFSSHSNCTRNGQAGRYHSPPPPSREGKRNQRGLQGQATQTTTGRSRHCQPCHW